jgi:hypothetical protein
MNQNLQKVHVKVLVFVPMPDIDASLNILSENLPNELIDLLDWFVDFLYWYVEDQRDFLYL